MVSTSHWSEPGAFRVADGVHRIPLPLPMDGLRAVNVYAIETEEGLTLIDGGWAVEESRSRLESSLEEIGYKVRDITRFLVTHVHRDHFTQAVTVRREFGSHISLGLGDKGTLDILRETQLEYDPTVPHLIRAGAPRLAESWLRVLGGSRPDPDHWGEPDTWLDGDTTLEVGSRQLAAVSTPGHTQGHYVFADLAAGLLFAGDHVLPTITPSIGFEPVQAELPLGDFLGSLTKVLALPDLALLPAHGPVASSSHDRARELLAHHDERLDACRAAVVAGCRTAYDVAGELPWTRHHRALPELDLFNSALATLETLAHLELLAARGNVRRTDGDGAWHYTVN